MSTAAFSSEPVTIKTVPLPTLEQLPDDPATLKQMILELLATLQEERRDKDALRHRLDLLLRRLYGPRSERYDPNQPLLFADALADGDKPATQEEPSAAEQIESPSARRRARPHGRRRLSANLERRPVHHELSEDERRCDCGQVRVDIGADVSEQLDYQPASLFIWQHFVHKYVCPRCAGKTATTTAADESTATSTASATADKTSPAGTAGTDTESADKTSPAGTTSADTQPVATPIIVSAAKPAMPIAKGLPGAGLLADVIVSKCIDHMPLHRQERRYERQGVILTRSTLCDWMAASATLLGPLYQLMVNMVLRSRHLHTDDTPVKIQNPKPGGLTTGRLWVYLGDTEHPYNVFDFTLNRNRDGPRDFLKDFAGYLHADAFSGYDGLYLPDPVDGVQRIIEVACNAHARRKFYEARGSDEVRAHQALAYYRQLYEIERRAQEVGADDDLRLRMRQDLAVPVLKQFKDWLDSQCAEVLPKSPLAQAIGYALNNWTALVRYTEAGFLSIDNNVAEREMKQIAIGRKNWLFVGSERGGQTAAVLFSFTATCKRLGVEPWAYLKDVLTRLPTTPADQLTELLPDRWEAARLARATAAAATGSAL